MADVTQANPTRISGLLTTIGGALLVGGGAVSAMGLAGGFDAAKLSSSFLFGALFWILLTMGCFGLMLLFHVTRGRWGTPVLRILEAGSSPFNLIFCFALVMIAGTVFKDPLYGAWLHAPADDMLVQNKKGYLNYNFWMIRQVIYFVLLIGLGYLLSSWTKAEIATGRKEFSDKRNNLAAPGIVIFILVMTFFITDFLMSVDPHWYSTVWGFLFTVGSCLSAMSLVVMIVVSQRDKAPFAGRIDDLMTKDFGNMLLMLTMLWGYLSFSQLLIMWSGNLKEFIPYYLKRIVGGYSNLGVALVTAQFLGPFLLLLSPRLKRTSWLLIPTAFLIFAIRFIETFWLVMPYFRESAFVRPADFGLLMLFGGVWMLIFSLGLGRGSLVVDAHPYQLHQPLEEATANV